MLCWLSLTLVEFLTFVIKSYPWNLKIWAIHNPQA
jgi:hypothetical protein